MKNPFTYTLILFSFGALGQVNSKSNKIVEIEIKQEMQVFYDKMRNVDLSWMEYLSEDATAVHNGHFHPHDEFVSLEKAFFNSLEKLEIEVLMEQVIYVLGSDAASVTIRHSVNSWTKTGDVFKDSQQTLTFIWQKRDEKWFIVHAHFVTKGIVNQ